MNAAIQPISGEPVEPYRADDMTANRVESRLSLAFVRRGARTQMRLVRQEPPQRVVRAFTDAQDGSALVHLHNLSGGVLGGDQLALDVTVQAEARAQVTTTGATRVYRARPGHGAARQLTNLHIARGGLLEYLPDQLIPFAGARYAQRTQITLAEDAGLFYWETIAPGRVAAGEVFAYARLEMELAICAPDGPILLERFELEPASRPLDSLARLGEFLYFGTFYICRAGAPAPVWAALEDELALLAQRHTQPDTVLWGVSRLPAHGLIVRAVAKTHRAIATTLPCFWRHAKQALYGVEPALPRKLY